MRKDENFSKFGKNIPRLTGEEYPHPPMKEFKLDGSEFIPLCDLMKATDLTSSGAEAKHIIAEGKVKVDGQVELRKRCKIRQGQEVEYNGEKVKIL